MSKPGYNPFAFDPPRLIKATEITALINKVHTGTRNTGLRDFFIGSTFEVPNKASTFF